MKKCFKNFNFQRELTEFKQFYLIKQNHKLHLNLASSFTVFNIRFKNVWYVRTNLNENQILANNVAAMVENPVSTCLFYNLFLCIIQVLLVRS